jgi:beta-1,4-glucosyltransferase
MNDGRQHGSASIAERQEIDQSVPSPTAASGQQKAVPDAHALDLLPLAGYPILSCRAVSVRHLLSERLARSQKTALLFANTNFVMTCRSLLPWLHSDEVLLINDGVGLDIAALLKHRQRYRDNLNGTDFLPAFLKSLRTRRKIFLFGGQPGVAKKAGIAIERDIGQQVVGCMDGYTRMSPEALRKLINQSGAEIVLVALGNPKQEIWIQANLQALDANLLIGVGAFFDFLSGQARRAPRWMQEIRCEWVYRLIQEPKRLLRRYTIDIVSFLCLCLRKQPKLPDRSCQM